MDRDSLALLLGQGLSMEEIARRFGKNPSTVAYWVRKHRLEVPGREKYAARGPLGRARLEEMVNAGMTISEIAAAVDRSKATVRHWLARHGLRTHNSQRLEVARDAKEAGQLTAMMRCRRHGDTEFGLEGRGYYRCKQCRVESVARHRRRLKKVLVTEAGGCCAVCGYDRYLGALEFHHVNPEEKRMSISLNGVTLALEAVRIEAQKCVLLCSNCHAEVEGGVTQLPATVAH